MASAAGEWPTSRPSSGVVSPRPMRSRTQSISSDRPSTIAHGLLSPPHSVSPEAAFIAASAASQIVTNDHDGHADMWYDQNGVDPSDETATVSPGALRLVNNFLDQLLFSFLQMAKGTTLAALRPAVSEVLKPKLAKDAINNADEELREYLGGADEDDYTHPPGSTAPRDWDLELIWKRTRLRCMVYSSLGDMEEEEEDLHMEQENLDFGLDESTYISPAVAIFLTSVLEYMGELTLTVAGQAAWHRTRAKLEKELREGIRSPVDMADPIVVEDLDMERVALDRTLGRLWRGWKKRIRSPTIDFGHSPHRGSLSQLRMDSEVNDAPARPIISDRGSEVRKSQDLEHAIAEDVPPSEIPLPLGDNDVAEIEVPGLVVHSDDEDDDEEPEAETQRPKSLLINSVIMADGSITLATSRPADLTRKRSNSVPTPKAALLHSHAKQSKAAVESTEAPEATESTKPAEPSVADEGSREAPAAVDEKTTEKAHAVEASERPEQVDQAEQVTLPKPAREVTSKAAKRKSRLSKISTGVEATVVAVAVASRGTSPLKESRSVPNEEDEIGTYEKAEIMTSSRISVAGSSSPSLSESGKPFVLKRSSSVHSARLIDVTGPKSPSSSRDTSLDPTERIRPASVSRASSISVPSNPEDSRKPKVLESAPRVVQAAPAARSPIDRVRPALQNATTISESDEELDIVPSPITSREAAAQFQVAQPPFGGRNMNAPGRQPYGYNSPATKVTVYGASSSISPVMEDQAPEVPRKAPGHNPRHPYRTDSIGQSPIERTRTRESDEDMGLPLQTNRPPRHQATGSSGSSVTGRIKAIRTSEDNSSSRADNMARNFEELIQSNQTITYTLTPENMRDIDAKRTMESPVMTKASRRSDDRSHNRSWSSSGATPEAKSPASYRSTGLNMHPVSEEKPAKLAGPVPRAPSGSGSALNRMAASQARDARTPSESMSDFANFIRSTGPPGGPPGAPPVDTRQSPVRNPNVPRTSVEQDPRRGSSASNRARYQPRDAIADSKTDNSDLIDFIRQGPPSAGNNPRIPRHVAPFRNTMDSDQFNAAVGGRAVDATIPEIRYSQASTNVTENSMPSMHSSVNSSSALLKKSSPAPTSHAFNDDDMMPKRKTRRVRDPYAIDFSDEEDDDFMPTAKPPVKKEESLAEFLRNYEPPPDPEPVPISQKVPKKKASAPSLIGRFSRRESKEPKETNAASSFSGSDSRSLNSRVGPKNGHIPIQVNIPPGYDAYGPLSSGASPRDPPAFTSSPQRRVPMKKFEPREAVSSTSRTSDLASFLRDSAPPDDPRTSPSRTTFAPEESNGLSKMFGRRKKASLY